MKVRDLLRELSDADLDYDVLIDTGQGLFDLKEVFVDDEDEEIVILGMGDS